MAISVVQTATGTGNPPVIFGSSITVGNTVILIAPCYNTSGSTNTITGVKIGTSTIPGTFACFNNGGSGTVNSASSGGNVASLAVWVIPNIGVSGQTNVDYTPSGSQVGQIAYEIAGLGTSPTLDQSASGSGIVTGTVTTGATGAITGAPELVVGGAMIFAGATGAPSGFTTANPTGDCWAGYQIATVSGGTYTWTQTGNGEPWAAALATILGTPAAPAPFKLLVSAPWRPAPPPTQLPAQVVTAPLPAPPALPAMQVQAAGMPYRAPWQLKPQVVTSGSAPVSLTLSTAQVTINALAPSLREQLNLPVAQVNINALAPSIRQQLSLPVAQVSINGLAPSLRVQLGLPVAQVNINALPVTVNVGGPIVNLTTAQVTIAALAPSGQLRLSLPVAQLTTAARPVSIGLLENLAKAGVAINAPAPGVFAGTSSLPEDLDAVLSVYGLNATLAPVRLDSGVVVYVLNIDMDS